MREECKFKVWDVLAKEWGDPKNFLIDGRGELYTRYGDDQVCNVDCFEVVRYTGVKDANGVEIYNGDYLGDIYGCVVGWCEGCAGFQLFVERCMACSGDCHWNEVVEDAHERKLVEGNIYETPGIAD